MRRREFIAGVGGAATALSAWPLFVAAQVGPAVIGYLGSGVATASIAALFRRGVSEAGLLEGRDFQIEFRFAAGEYARLPELANDLVRHPISVLIASGGVQTALAAKAATRTIPIVFALGGDPVKFGLVESLSRPGGNVTGIYLLTSELESKRLGLLLELVPWARTVAVLLNPSSANAENQTTELKRAGQSLGVELHIVHVDSDHQFQSAFAAIGQKRVDALLVAADPFYFGHRQQLVAFAAQYSIPAMYDFRAYVEEGGLVSYGTDLGEAYRHVGIYAGRILRGERPADLPVMQSTKFEFVLNLKTAKALRLDVPPVLSARADEVIE